MLDGTKDGGAEVANSIASTVKFYQDRQSGRIRQQVISARLYGNASLWGVSGLTKAQAQMPGASLKERVTDNVVQSVIDTATARIGENKPRPYFLTSGGSYKQQRKAKKLNQFSEGIFYENNAYELGGAAQRDCEIFGDGLLHVYERNERVCMERVLSSEFWVDEVEGAYGCPRQGHWVRPAERGVVLAWIEDSYEGAERKRLLKVVEDASRVSAEAYGTQATESDMVELRESWHLRSGPESKDGKHCISIDGNLIDPLTEWKHDFFPFARFVWCPRPLGYWSQGLAEQLMSKQIEINKLLTMIQQSMNLASGIYWAVEMGSKVVKEHLSNQMGKIIEYRGTRPEPFVAQPIHPDFFQHYKDLKISCYEQAGISLQSATGQKPAGLNSGEAQRVYRDTVDERMKTQERLNERGYMELSEIAIAIAREIAERKGHYEVKAPSGRVLKAIRLSAEELDPSGWEQQCFPTSSLPRDPSGRLQTITEYIQAGFLTQRQGRKLLDFPDLEAAESLFNAMEDLISMTLDAICDEGEYAPPEPTIDLNIAKEMVVEYINRGTTQELEEERIDMLRTWSLQLDALQAAAMPPPMPGAVPGMPGAPPGGAPPQAVPMPPPQSPLLPNAPGAMTG